MKHYTFGSSTAARTDACQAWRRESADVPKQPESSYAVDGTIVHGLLEALALGDPLPDIIEGHRADVDHKALATEFWAETEALLDELGVEELEPEVTATTAEDVGGTLDLVGVTRKKAGLLLDYKTGIGVQVEATGNKQILFAAANLLYGDSPAKDLIEGVDKFIGVIMQPDQSGEIQVKRWDFTLDIVDAWWHDHQNNILIARQCPDDLEPVAGDHCKFCPANGLCDATTGNLLRMKQLDPEDIEQLAWGLSMIKEVEATIAAIQKKALQALEVGQEIPGWKLVAGRAGNTAWEDEEAALRALKRLTRGLRTDDDKRVATLLQAKKTLTPTQAAKLLKQHGVPKASIDSMLEKYTYRPPAKSNVLAPEEDSREAVLSTEALSQALNSVK